MRVKLGKAVAPFKAVAPAKDVVPGIGDRRAEKKPRRLFACCFPEKLKFP